MTATHPPLVKLEFSAARAIWSAQHAESLWMGSVSKAPETFTLKGEIEAAYEAAPSKRAYISALYAIARDEAQKTLEGYKAEVPDATVHIKYWAKEVAEYDYLCEVYLN